MSAKWRALQHRHRYTYGAVVFPDYYIDALDHLPSDSLPKKFSAQLKDLASLNSTYSQVNHVKNVASSFSDLLTSGDESAVSIAARFYLEILFLENSSPLHRTLVSVLAKSRNFRGVIGECFRTLCEEYGGLRGKGKRFCVARVALLMMSTPKLGYIVEVVEECCLLVALDIVCGLNSVVSETNVWACPSPLVMEQCQEALSCLYYILQRSPSKFTDSGSCQSELVPKDSNLLESIVTVILSILKSSAFSRDCFVAAGVSFCVALQGCLGPEEVACLILEGILNQTAYTWLDICHVRFKDVVNKVPYKDDLHLDLKNLSALSRLCLIRGILTAVSRSVLNIQFAASIDTLDGIQENGSCENSTRTLLYDGILPELCMYCENPTDSHFNFHALTVMQICLQQIKTSLSADLVDRTANFDLMPEDMLGRILRIIWNNLEDPLSQTVKQAHLILDLLLDIRSTIHRGSDTGGVKSFFSKIAVDLLHLGSRCKGRYIPLASITKRLGAKTILDMKQNLLFETIHAYVDDDVCCAATSFLKCFLEHLRDECWSSDGIERGYELYRAKCLPPILCGLASGVSKLRSNLNTYALQTLLQVDVDSIFPMLAFLSIEVGEEIGPVYPELSSLDMTLKVEQKVAAFVSLLKVSRSLALFTGDVGSCSDLENETALIFIKGIKVKVPVEWLVLALTHVDEPLRVDAAESLFLNPKTASLPSLLELSLMRLSVPLNMRCCSTAFQMKWTSLFKKFISRVRTALERQIKQGTWRPSPCNYVSADKLSNGYEDAAVKQAGELYSFMKWLSCFLFLSCYPSAPYERKIMAMELILIMFNIWSVMSPFERKSSSVSPEDGLYPYHKGLTLPDSTLLLVGSIVDSWDRLRVNSFRILLGYPTPLPGLLSQDMIQEVIAWARKLVSSPRVRESDAGALTLRLIFRKYVVELGWMVKVVPTTGGATNNSVLEAKIKSSFPVMQYLNSLVSWLCDAVEEGEKDLSKACKNNFVHGILLALRYTFEELDWNSDMDMSCVPDMRYTLEKLLDLVMRITSLALWVVSADAWYLPEDMDDLLEDEGSMLELRGEMDACASALEHNLKDQKLATHMPSSEQIVMVGCWLAMKEVSLLLGTIIRKIPLPSSTSSGGKECPDAAVDPLMQPSDVVLDVQQLEAIGNHFLEVLLKMKHNGAIDKTRAGFTALCNRLLCSDDPRLCQLTESWMDQLMERTVAKGQTVDDLLRRSAGIPAAFSAFFLSEPEGTPKKLLPRALRWLIDVAAGSLLDKNNPGNMKEELYENLAVLSSQSNTLKWAPEADSTMISSKIRVEGVIPMVHAFNVLRTAFNDTNLASDTSGFSAEAMIVSICSFSSPHWEVRNGACLAYTALIRRMIGFLNVHKRESARRALTGLEFFHRYPSLHSFLFNELEVATEMLRDERSYSNLANVVHPSLCPMLILLSRIKASPIASEAGDDLDPFLFMPFIQRCSMQSNLRIRILASRALTGLVSDEKLHTVLLNIASKLPSTGIQMDGAPTVKISSNDISSHVSFNSIHGSLLQLIALLDTNCENLIDPSRKSFILEDLVQTLSRSSWIGSPRTCGCPILNCSFLKVLDHMLRISRTCNSSKNINTISRFLFDLAAECLVVEASVGESFYDPTISELRKQAAISYFSCVFQKTTDHAEVILPVPHRYSPASNIRKGEAETKESFNGVSERLMLSMSDSSYEVRLVTFKWLHQFLRATEGDCVDNNQYNGAIAALNTWAKANLHPKLIELLSLETHHKCTCYILRILFTWNSLQFHKLSGCQSTDIVYIGDMHFESVLPFWNNLLSMYELARHTKIREALICCMGLCVKRITAIFRGLTFSNVPKEPVNLEHPDDLVRSTALYECTSHFVFLVKRHSESSEPVNIRKAAAESVVASGLLGQAEFVGSSVSNVGVPAGSSHSRFDPEDSVNGFAYLVLDTWFTAIKLLEDEDVGLRQKLALDVQKSFPEGFGRSPREGLVPAQVEKVIALSFELLSLIFGRWVGYLDYLLQWVFDAASYVVSEGDLVRRVFDKEIDNYHEEKLLICQICCAHLEKLGVSTSLVTDNTNRCEFVTFLKTWRKRFYQRLVSFANDHMAKLGGVDWIGGVGNHKDAFLPLYANLLAVYALSSCIFSRETDDAAHLMSNVIEVGISIRPFFSNPLICNLYIIVFKQHEQMVEEITQPIPELQERTQLWDGFHPYFLLK